MKPYIFIIAYCLLTTGAIAQSENTAIRNGNKLYRQEKFEAAIPEYQKALQQNSGNPITSYNFGNTQFRLNNFAEAEKLFDETIAQANGALQQKAYYNKGLALYKQKKLVESIDAWKTALTMDPSDEDTRINLQKALSELQQQKESDQQQQQQPQKPEPKDQQKPQPNKSKLDRKKIEQYLKSLQQKEQEVQRKIQQNRTPSVSRPEKDW